MAKKCNKKKNARARDARCTSKFGELLINLVFLPYHVSRIRRGSWGAVVSSMLSQGRS